MAKDELLGVRDQIDQVDLKIQTLLNERAELAQNVAEIKQRQSSEDVLFYRPEREADVLRRVQERNNGPLPDKTVAALFREIMSACLALEHPMKIAYLGPEGTYTQEAAIKQFGHAAHWVALSAIDEIFREVASGSAQYGVVPIENSTEGVINHTLDMFLNSSLKICGEVELKIHHQLLSKEVDPSRITTVYSNQQSLAQCREWLDHNLPHAERVPVKSNGEAARLAETTDCSAAIASKAAADIYHLTVLSSNIEDQAENSTRFLVLGKEAVGPSEKDKTSLILTSKNHPGALHDVLMPFAENNVNMTRIESRPSQRGLWEYVFFIDIEGHQSNEVVAKAIISLGDVASNVRVLGSYPQAVI